MNPKQLILSIMCFACFGLASLKAETHTAKDLTPEAVLLAIQIAKDGDTVELPAGETSWSKGWNTGKNLPLKAITIRGAGIDKTIIHDATSTKPGETPFHLIGVEGKPFRLTGITFDGTGLLDAGSYEGLVHVSGNCKDFRIDHCQFNNAARMMNIDGDTYGVIDHCEFLALEAKEGRLVQTIKVSGPGKTNFRKPLKLGSAEALYFEDNEVRFSPEVVNPTGNNPWIANYNGSRLVVRHTQLTNTQVEIYRVKESGDYCSQSAEIYDNTFIADGLKKFRPQGIIFIGGGTAMVFNNTVHGTTHNRRTIELQHVRAYRDFLPHFPKADGKNPLDANQVPAGQPGAGYPCMCQPGRATDADGDGVFELAPCHAWNNTLNGEKLEMTVPGTDPNEIAHLQLGRDFFNTPPAENTYRPFTYPHPLVKP